MRGRKKWTILGVWIFTLMLMVAGCGSPSASSDGGKDTGGIEAGSTEQTDEDGSKRSRWYEAWEDDEDDEDAQGSYSDSASDLDKDGSYTSKEDVMNYLIQYNRLPDNFITKKEARSLGWEGGSLEPYAPGKCIGGDRFSNYEETLPVVKGRKYYECDIDTLGARKRGAKRIVYSDDGQIYYTEDHYETFELLYGDDSQ